MWPFFDRYKTTTYCLCWLPSKIVSDSHVGWHDIVRTRILLDGCIVLWKCTKIVFMCNFDTFPCSASFKTRHMQTKLIVLLNCSEDNTLLTFQPAWPASWACSDIIIDRHNHAKLSHRPHEWQRHSASSFFCARKSSHPSNVDIMYLPSVGFARKLSVAGLLSIDYSTHRHDGYNKHGGHKSRPFWWGSNFKLCASLIC